MVEWWEALNDLLKIPEADVHLKPLQEAMKNLAVKAELLRRNLYTCDVCQQPRERVRGLWDLPCAGSYCTEADWNNYQWVCADCIVLLLHASDEECPCWSPPWWPVEASQLLAEYNGTYSDTGGGVVTITQLGNVLEVTNAHNKWNAVCTIAPGTVDGKTLSMHGLIGTYSNGQISWSNGHTWTLQPPKTIKVMHNEGTVSCMDTVWQSLCGGLTSVIPWKDTLSRHT